MSVLFEDKDTVLTVNKFYNDLQYYYTIRSALHHENNLLALLAYLLNFVSLPACCCVYNTEDLSPLLHLVQGALRKAPPI